MRGFAYIAAHTQIFEREAVLRYYFSVISSCQGAYCQKFFVYIDVFETECGFTVLIDLYETLLLKKVDILHHWRFSDFADLNKFFRCSKHFLLPKIMVLSWAWGFMIRLTLWMVLAKHYFAVSLLQAFSFYFEGEGD